AARGLARARAVRGTGPFGATEARVMRQTSLVRPGRGSPSLPTYPIRRVHTQTARGRDPMSNYTPTPRHVHRMRRDHARDEWLRQAEAHVALARNWHDMGRPEVAREAVEEYVAKALDIANDIRKYALRKQQERARQIEADLAALGFTR